MDFIEMYPGKTIILSCSDIIGENDWPSLELYNEKFDLILELYQVPLYEKAVEHGIKFMFPQEINTYYLLKEVAAMNPAYVKIGPPLSFDLQRVRSFKIPVRMIANISASFFHVPRINNIRGQWIRPEDVPKYEPYVTALEFCSASLNEEKNYLYTYQKGCWLGNLNLLLPCFGINVDNRALPEDLGLRRLNCGQRCMAGMSCDKCESAIQWSSLMQKLHDLQSKEHN